jgi:hypothetical protein
MAKTDTYTIDDLILEIESKIRIKTKKIVEDKQRLNENFIYWFSWVGEEYYSALYLVGLLENLKSVVEEDGMEGLNRQINANTEFVMRPYNVREKSTSELSNAASTYQYRMRLEFIEDMNKWKRLIDESKK